MSVSGGKETWTERAVEVSACRIASPPTLRLLCYTSGLELAAAMPQRNDLLQEAVALHRRGVVVEAGALYSALLQAEPHHTDAHYYLGLISCQQRRLAYGAERARRALSGDPGHARAHVPLGRALGALGQHEDALASFDRALAPA
jgi:tetratricopeptide (TPR) repeat protein